MKFNEIIAIAVAALVIAPGYAMEPSRNTAAEESKELPVGSAGTRLAKPGISTLNCDIWLDPARTSPAANARHSTSLCLNGYQLIFSGNSFNTQAQQLEWVEVTSTGTGDGSTVVLCRRSGCLQTIGFMSAAERAASWGFADLAVDIMFRFGPPKKLNICPAVASTKANDTGNLKAGAAIFAAVGTSARAGDRAEVRYSDGSTYTFEISAVSINTIHVEPLYAGGGPEPKCT